MSVGFDSASTANRFTASPTTQSVVPSAGSNTILVAIACYDNTSGMSISGVTFNGIALTQAGADDHNATGHEYAGLWYLVNPPTGSHALVITESGGTIGDIYGGASMFTGVDQGTPIRPGSYSTGGGTAKTDGSGNYSLVISSNSNDLTITCINSGASATHTSNQTRDGQSIAGIYGFAWDHATSPASSVTHTWTGTANSQIAVVGFSLQAAGGETVGEMLASMQMGQTQPIIEKVQIVHY